MKNISGFLFSFLFFFWKFSFLVLGQFCVRVWASVLQIGLLEIRSTGEKIYVWKNSQVSIIRRSVYTLVEYLIRR